MNYEKITIETKYGSGELWCYEHSESPELPVDSRRAMLVLPGGAYAFCSDRESEIIAIPFYERGYNAYVLKYPCAPTEFPAQLTVAAAAMHEIRSRAKTSKTDPKRVYAVGFSAGGHLCGSLANCPPDLAPVKKYDFKPNGVILSYPVIGGEDTHIPTFDNLLGGKIGAKREKGTEWLDLHTSVRDDNPPAFIWSTANDDAVPIANSLRMASAYAEKKIPFELHIYKKGPHGISVANEQVAQFNPEANNPTIAGWVELADKFLRSLDK